MEVSAYLIKGTTKLFLQSCLGFIFLCSTSVKTQTLDYKIVDQCLTEISSFKKITTVFHLTPDSINGEVLSYWPNGNLCARRTYRDNLPVGEFICYHPNGALWWKASYTSDHSAKNSWFPDDTPPLDFSNITGFHKDQGIPEGFISERDPYDRPLLATFFDDGELEGHYKKWYPLQEPEGEPVLKSEGNYHKGRKVGPWVENQADGTPQKRTNYADGLFHGRQLFYRNDGSLSREVYYQAGEKHGAEIVYYTPDQLKEKGTFFEGQKDGKRSEWHPNGQLKSQGKWDKGRPIGPHRAWWESGQLISEAQYKDGVAHGTYTGFYRNGNQRVLRTHVEGKLEGKAVSWRSNGSKMWSGAFSNDQKNGWFYFYDEEKKLLGEVLYKKDQSIEIKRISPTWKGPNFPIPSGPRSSSRPDTQIEVEPDGEPFKRISLIEARLVNRATLFQDAPRWFAKECAKDLTIEIQIETNGKTTSVKVRNNFV